MIETPLAGGEKVPVHPDAVKAVEIMFNEAENLVEDVTSGDFEKALLEMPNKLLVAPIIDDRARKIDQALAALELAHPEFPQEDLRKNAMNAKEVLKALKSSMEQKAA